MILFNFILFCLFIQLLFVIINVILQKILNHFNLLSNLFMSYIIVTYLIIILKFNFLLLPFSIFEKFQIITSNTIIFLMYWSVYNSGATLTVIRKIFKKVPIEMVVNTNSEIILENRLKKLQQFGLIKKNENNKITLLAKLILFLTRK